MVPCACMEWISSERAHAKHHDEAIPIVFVRGGRFSFWPNVCIFLYKFEDYFMDMLW